MCHKSWKGLIGLRERPMRIKKIVTSFITAEQIREQHEHDIQVTPPLGALFTSR